MPLLLIWLLLTPVFAASIEETLDAAINEQGLSCPPEAPNYCQDFQAEGCKQNDFQLDGTGEVRTLKGWDARVKAGVEKVVPGLKLELKSLLKNLSKARWEEVSQAVTGKATCKKFPATANCLNLVLDKHARSILTVATTQAKKPASPFGGGPFGFDGIGSDPLNILPLASYLKFSENLLNQVRYKEDEDKMRGMEQDIRELLKQRIAKANLPEATKTMLGQRLDDTSFGGFECDDNSLLRSYSITGAYNTKVGDKNVITYCAGNFRTNSSSFNLAYLLAHEFAHSIDPCNVKPTDLSKNERTALEKQHPFSNIVSCLRSPDSVGAEWTPEFYQENLPTLSLCVGDQIGESFSDWMAAEIVPQYIESKHPNLTTENWKQGFLNVSRTLSCAPASIRPGGGVDAHPRPKARINKIMLANEKIKSLVGCGDSEVAAVQCKETTNVAELTPPRDPGRRIGIERLGMQFPIQNSLDHSHQSEACFTRH